MAGAPLGRIRFEMPAGRGRKARAVEQEVRVQRVLLPDRQGSELEVTCLIASEVNAPAGAKPVGLAAADQPDGIHATGRSGARQLVPRAVGN